MIVHISIMMFSQVWFVCSRLTVIFLRLTIKIHENSMWSLIFLS